ncbi:MAG: hypothetical protein IT536_10405 [Hyphomicrobiales bacterium]|nr:hypothetical protein [Hyphomicrobiales bacterium]
MNRMSPGTLVALVVAVAGIVFLIYGLIVSTQIDTGTTGAGSRPPIQDQAVPRLDKPNKPLIDSNVPPAVPPDRPTIKGQ